MSKVSFAVDATKHSLCTLRASQFTVCCQEKAALKGYSSLLQLEWYIFVAQAIISIGYHNFVTKVAKIWEDDISTTEFHT